MQLDSRPAVPGAADPAAALPHRRWRVGRFLFDATTRRLVDSESSGQGAGEQLSVKTAAVLQRLAEAGGDVVLRERLITEVWDGNTYTGSRALTHAVWQLRRALDDAPADQGAPADEAASAIQTISKTGYQLRLPAVAEPAPAAASLPISEAPAMPEAQAAPVTSANKAPFGRLAAMAGALVLVLVLAIAAGAAWWLQPGKEKATAGVDSTPPQPMTLLDGVENYPAVSPDGQRLAFVWSRGEGDVRLRIVERNRPEAPVIELREPAEMHLASPMWLGPDRLAYARAREGEDCEIVALTLPEGQPEKLASCFYQFRIGFVDASPDGRWLALARPLKASGKDDTGGGAIFLHEIATGQERQLTHPSGGETDVQPAFSRSGKQLAFMRGSITVGDVFLVDVADATQGEATRLTHDDAPLGGMAWLADDRGIAFNSARDGTQATWRISPQGGEPTLFSRAQTAIHLATLPGEPNAVAASVYKFADSIELLDGHDGHLRETLAASSRNLYAQACPSAGQVLFLSFRSGRIGLWTVDRPGQAPRELPLPPGTPEPAGCAADEPRWATTLRPPGSATDLLLLGRLNRDEPPQAIPLDGNYGNVTWALDKRSLLLAGDRGGRRELWRFDLASHQFLRLTDDHGQFGQEVQAPDGRWLYYTRQNEAGLWRRPLDAQGGSGTAQRVHAGLSPEDWGNWQWHEGALWLVLRGKKQDRVVRLDADGQHETLAFTLPAGWLRRFRSFSLAPNGTLVASVSGPLQADVVRLAGP